MSENGIEKLMEMFGMKDTSQNPFSDILAKYSTPREDDSCPEEEDGDDGTDWKGSYISLKEEFDSFRRRSEVSKTTERRNLSKELITGFLEVLDYIVFVLRSKDARGTNTAEDGMILNKLYSFLSNYGVKPMGELVGKTFDHNLHDAVMADCSGKYPVDTITNVVSQGYMMGDEVLRHAKVVVSTIQERNG